MAEGVTTTAFEVFIAHLADVAVAVLRHELALAMNAETLGLIHVSHLLSSI